MVFADGSDGYGGVIAPAVSLTMSFYIMRISDRNDQAHDRLNVDVWAAVVMCSKR